MAISKILYMKDCGRNFPGKHLKVAIEYISVPDKTQNGKFVAGLNCQPDAAYEQMKQTKIKFGKTDKRQGYHLIISFEEGEVDADTAFEIIGKIAKEYLGEEYEAVYAVHDNTEHVHDFVLEVLDTDNVYDKGYCFDIDLEVEDAFENAHTLNRISKMFKDVYGVVYSDYEMLDVSEYIPQVVAATISLADVKSKIASDPIWDHVYLANGIKNRFDDVYVRGKIYDDDYEDALILWPTDEKDSYVRAISSMLLLNATAQFTSYVTARKWFFEFVRCCHIVSWSMHQKI